MKKQNFTLINKWLKNKWYNAVMIVESGRWGNTYFLVKMDINTSTIKPSDSESPFTYEIKRYEDDTICNHTSRPLDYVSQESINAAHRLLEKNLRELRKIIKSAKNHPAYNTLEYIASTVIKNYKSDFYFHDSLFMATNPNHSFIVSMGENGSYIFIYRQNWDTLDYVTKNYKDNRFFYYDGDSNTMEITAEESKIIVKSLPNFEK